MINKGAEQSENNSSSTSFLITGIILAILFLALGLGIGYFIFQNKPTPNDRLLEFQSSPIITNISVTFAGEVKEINNNSITVEKDGESTQITLGKFVRLRKKINPNPQDPTIVEYPKQEIITLSDINIGDPVTITALIKPSGELEGIYVGILESTDLLPRK